MHETKPAREDGLRLTLHLELRLARRVPESNWTADLRVPGSNAVLRFASMPALLAYLARLDTPSASNLR